MSVSAFILNGNTFYSLENKNGMKLDVSPFGAGVVGIYTKDKKGEFKNVSLTPTDLFEYKKSSCRITSYNVCYTKLLRCITFCTCNNINSCADLPAFVKTRICLSTFPTSPAELNNIV